MKILTSVILLLFTIITLNSCEGMDILLEKNNLIEKENIIHEGNYELYGPGSDLDDFNYTGIEGSLIIRDTTITNLNNLKDLTHIHGFLIIDNNDKLASISGLKKLIYIGSNFYFTDNDKIDEDKFKKTLKKFFCRGGTVEGTIDYNGTLIPKENFDEEECSKEDINEDEEDNDDDDDD